ncbi:hypothetical protein BKK51_11405 [Rodentibacter trehalosifermentans]|uniref:Restriction endonuclease subunit M n=1 Tax=Rodentibacter trehalosifermentans TaxID=1908263 RepID=A0A1V3IN30_9PAST|nr:hypothetical protein [Rodentibacter trehalosifermentans]OOF43475.1 hypothetical protein BKK51_11405 [Rodentibacter trehalosifermentans]
MQVKSQQVKSKQRVADFGEVYTNEREVNAMLDLVADQASSPEKTFLEPACGTGNFLVEILKRKLFTSLRLSKINKSQKRPLYCQDSYEFNSILAVCSIYGIEKQPDNVDECRKRLLMLFKQHYQDQFPNSYKPKCIDVADFILKKNILWGDALSLRNEETGESIIFSEWKPIGKRIQQRNFIYSKLVNNQISSDLVGKKADDGNIPQQVFDSVDDYPPVYFLELGNDRSF